MNEALCPWCSAPRGTGPDCPHCGANYAKAAAIRRHGRAAAGPQPLAPGRAGTGAAAYAEEQSPGPGMAADPGLEWKYCVGAIPAALAIALFIHTFGPGRALLRIVFGMPIHELGHAVTAWFCGYAAIPVLWKTIIPDGRGFVAPVALAAASGWMLYRGYLEDRWPAVAAGAVLLILQVIATFGISPKTARMLITFGGDGCGMILATLLMCSFFFGKDTQLYRSSLRWGFVGIGAAAFVDLYGAWWAARLDRSAVPLGTVDGTVTDSITLIGMHSWKIPQLINNFFTVGVCCLLVLAAVYAWGVLQARLAIPEQTTGLRH